jgi:hypothetical protein
VTNFAAKGEVVTERRHRENWSFCAAARSLSTDQARVMRRVHDKDSMSDATKGIHQNAGRAVIVRSTCDEAIHFF